MNNSRSALVTLDYPPERGGVARYLGNLVQVAHGSIDVFVPETHQALGPGQVQTAHLVRSGLWPWTPMIGFIRHLRARGYTQVFVSHALPVGTAAWIARRLGGLPYGVFIHGLELRISLGSWRKSWLLKKVLRGASQVIANSQVIAHEIQAFDPSLKVQVLTPGVEPMTFSSRTEAREALSMHTDPYIVLAVARLVPRKGLDRLIEALSYLPTMCQLVIVGDGEDRHRLEHLIEERQLQDRIRIIPRASDIERNQWYAAADVFALPVRDEGRDVEGFGIVYLEAAAAGLPVIAGKSGGAPEAIVDGVTGVLVDPNDTEALAATLKQLMENPALRERLGHAGRERVLRDFRWEERWDRLRASI